MTAPPETADQAAERINGVDVAALTATVRTFSQTEAPASWSAVSAWSPRGVVTSETACTLPSAEETPARHVIVSDLPRALGGQDGAPDPEAALLAAINACVAHQYAALCAVNGVSLEKLRVESEAAIDLNATFRPGPNRAPGFERIRLRIFIEADASEPVLEKIHRLVRETSPALNSLARAVEIEAVTPSPENAKEHG